MMVQPWQLDSYPFVAEAVYVSRIGHLGDIQYLMVNPAQGLTFGPFLSITSMSPILLLKIYPAFLATFFTVFVFLISRKLGIGAKYSVVASLLFTSILWPNVFHYARQGFSLTYYFVSFFLLMWLIFRGYDRRILALLILQILVFNLSHPATPLVFMYNLAAMGIIGWFSRKIGRNQLRLISQALIVCLIIWLLWNLIGTTPNVIGNIKGMIENISKALSENPLPVSGVTKIFGHQASIYSTVIDIRFLFTFLVYGASFLVPLIALRYVRERKVLLILTGWVWSSASIAIPFIFAGLPYFYKPALFIIVAWSFPVAFVLEASRSKKIGKAFFVIVVAFIVSSSLLIPATKYGSLPLEYAPTTELYNKDFLDFHAEKSMGVIYYEGTAFYHAYLLYNQSEQSGPVYVVFWQEYSRADPNVTVIWTTYRAIVRDAFFVTSPTMYELVKNNTETYLNFTHNKVYDAGWPEWILVPIPSSEMVENLPA
jgi:hypothetical protein